MKKRVRILTAAKFFAFLLAIILCFASVTLLSACESGEPQARRSSSMTLLWRVVRSPAFFSVFSISKARSSDIFKISEPLSLYIYSAMKRNYIA